MNAKLIADLAEWLSGSDTGVSSKTIALIAMGAVRGRFDAPYDPDDFGRCYRLVHLFPELKKSFAAVSALVPAFSGILRNWDELCALYREEFPSGRAPRLYARIKKLRAGQ